MVQKVAKIWFDGAMVNWDDAQIHLLTHTLHYGLGVFEGVRAYQRADGRVEIFRLRDHILRLFEGSKIATIPIPFKPEQVEQACVEVVRVNRLTSGYLRPLVFVGDGAMGLHAMSNRTHVAVIAWPWGSYLGEDGLAHGIRARISSFTRHGVNSSMVKAKITGQYVNSILAKREAMADGYDEAMLLDAQGYVCEATGENIFIVRNGTLLTPPQDASILDGLTRHTILTLAAEFNIPIHQQRLTRDTIYGADEVFLTGTAAEVTPVREVDRRIIGTGKPGPITLRLQERYFDIVRGEDTAHIPWLHFVHFD